MDCVKRSRAYDLADKNGIYTAKSNPSGEHQFWERDRHKWFGRQNPEQMLCTVKVDAGVLPME
ncbi:hypothetical protein MnTg02_03162 [bacterium MnTg02]|nr:hypothetical protein MnTg02_03162 [bacterium MnTg02]